MEDELTYSASNRMPQEGELNEDSLCVDPSERQDSKLSKRVFSVDSIQTMNILRGLSARSVSSSRDFGSWSPATQSCVTFSDASLRRCTGAFQVIRGFGSVLSQGNVNDVDIFNLSHHTNDMIRWFLSHNWPVERRQKFLALALHFNLNTAYVAMLTSQAIAFFFAVNFDSMFVDICPSGQAVHHRVNFACHRASFACYIVGVPVFLLALLVQHEVKIWFGAQGPRVFFDRLCIHQTDQELKRKAIEHLGAFLFASEAMLVIYSKSNLEKLWTVYELATVLLLMPTAQVVIVPVRLPVLLIWGMIILHLFVGLLKVSGVDSGLEALKAGQTTMLALWLVAVAPICVGIAFMLRDWVRQRASIKEQVANFSVRSVACAVESDRTQIQHNIALFLKDVGLAPADTDQDEAMELFDRIVREEVPPKLKKSLGRIGVSYKHVVVLSVSILSNVGDEVANDIVAGDGVRHAVLSGVSYMAQGLAVTPLALVLLTWLLGRHLKARGVREWTLVVASTLVVVVVRIAMLMLVEQLKCEAKTDDYYLLMFIVVVCALAALVIAAFAQE